MLIDPGTEIDGRYRVGTVLGVGSMGAVYEAVSIEGGDEVAIKVLHRQFARDAEVTRRFAREAQAAADIGHAGIVPVIATGTHEGIPYLVMPRLRGETLAQRIGRLKRLPVGAACRIIGHVLSALASTHAKGIVHRDLKPDNVFLDGDGAAETVKVLDFGISKFRPTSDASDLVTIEGVIMGTPGYMAPEQWMGSRDIDHRADLFGVGAMLYELLTGKVPYGGENQSEFFLEVVRGTLPPERPSSLAPDVGEGLDRIVLRALQRDPRERFTSAREFLDALRPHGAGSITAVSWPPAPLVHDEAPSPPAPRVPAVIRRSARRSWAAPLVAAAVLALGMVALLLRPVPQRRAPAPPTRPGLVDSPSSEPADRVSLALLPARAAPESGPDVARPGPVARVPAPRRPGVPASRPRRAPTTRLQALPIAPTF